MMETLTEKERAFMEKMERNRMKHNEAQKKYKEANKEKVKEYNDTYQANLKQQKTEIRKKLLKTHCEATETPIEEILKKAKDNKDEIKPSYKTRKNPLEESTIEDYIRKSNILNKLFKGQDLPQAVKEELKKLLKDEAIDQNFPSGREAILEEMDYIKDVDETINKIRTKYKTDNTFNRYINILSVISSHFEDLNAVHQVYSGVAKETKMKIEDKREENTLEEYEKDKIILVGEDEFFNNHNKLDKIEDILIYALYLLFPSRRLDYRNMILTKEEDTDELNEINYLIIADNMKFVFNDYKTSKTYKKQIFNVPINLKNVIKKYISIKGLNDGDLLFATDKKKIISEGNFSQKISNVFKKVYDIPICVRYLRMSWVSNLYRTNPTAKQIKELALKMSHSAEESRLYNKIFKKD